MEDGKFEMWLDGRLVDKGPGAQLYNHSDDNAIGAVNQNTVFHDNDGSQAATGWYSGGMIDEVWVLNEALSPQDLGSLGRGVDLEDKLAASWGAIKVQR